MEVDRKKFPHEAEGGKAYYSDLKVMRSAAGYYIGTSAWDVEGGYEEPNSRESDYFGTHAEAENALKKEGFIVRDCVENNIAYASGELPAKLPGLPFLPK